MGKKRWVFFCTLCFFFNFLVKAVGIKYVDTHLFRHVGMLGRWGRRHAGMGGWIRRYLACKAYADMQMTHMQMSKQGM